MNDITPAEASPHGRTSRQFSVNRSTDTAPLVCSAKGCRSNASQAVRWNNPRLHDAERRKVWLACDTHEMTLREFLSVRGFYRDTIDVNDLSETDG